ncbi:hypothetical protein ABEX78_22520 [Priestia megaterium]
MNNISLSKFMEKHNIEIGHSGIEEKNPWVSLKVTTRTGLVEHYKVSYTEGRDDLLANVFFSDQPNIFTYKALLAFPLILLKNKAEVKGKDFKIVSSTLTVDLLSAFIVDNYSAYRVQETTLNESSVKQWLEILCIVSEHPAVQKVIQVTPNLLFKTITGETFEIKWHDGNENSSYKIREFRDGAQLQEATIEFLNTFLDQLLTQETVVSKTIKKLTSSNDETYSEFEVRALLSAVKSGLNLSSLDRMDSLVSSDMHFKYGDDIYYAEKSYIFTSALKSS